MANYDGTATDSTSNDNIDPDIDLQKEGDTELASKLREMFGDQTTKAFEGECWHVSRWWKDQLTFVYAFLIQ